MTVLVDGSPAPEYASRGRVYIEALRGREFTIRLYNPGPGRAAVALSVDGRNVLDAKRTTAAEASKWVLAPGGSLDVPGWQISGQVSRRFFFTETERSYASWLGDTSNVGTIEAVFYREKRPVVAQRPAVKDEPDWIPDRSLEQHSEIQVDGANADEGEASRSGGMAREETMADSGPQEFARVQPRSRKPSPSASAPGSAAPEARREADRFAATGIGNRTSFAVEWIAFEQEARPAVTLGLRYEFHEQLVRLGVLPREERALYARERARGFEPEYAPDPDRRR
jgi:hypothetical protein